MAMFSTRCPTYALQYQITTSVRKANTESTNWKYSTIIWFLDVGLYRLGRTSIRWRWRPRKQGIPVGISIIPWSIPKLLPFSVYGYCRILGGIFNFEVDHCHPLSDNVHWIGHPRKYRYSRWNCTKHFVPNGIANYFRSSAPLGFS